MKLGVLASRDLPELLDRTLACDVRARHSACADKRLQRCRPATRTRVALQRILQHFRHISNDVRQNARERNLDLVNADARLATRAPNRVERTRQGMCDGEVFGMKIHA